MGGKLKTNFFYMPTFEQIQFCRIELETKQFSRRGIFDGNPYQKLLGVLNEVVICDELGLDRPVLNEKPISDKGYDFVFDGLKIDVKARVFNPKFGNPCNPRFDHLVPITQIKPVTDAFLFTAINARNKHIMVCGYLTKTEFLKRAFLAKKGQTFRKYNGSVFTLKTNNYVVLNENLDREGGTPLFRMETKTEGPNGAV
jgi:hypothetical protein